MRKSLLTGTTVLSLMTVAMMTTSCDSENDLNVNNPEQAKLDASWAEKFGSIDPSQNWSLADTAKAVISTYGLNALADYQLQLYTDNPISSSSAKLMASKKVTTDANGNASASFVVDIVKGNTVFYACYIDKDNRRNAKPVALVNGTITAQFGQPASSKSKMAKASATSDGLEIPNVDNPQSDVMAKYSQAKEVNSENQNNQNKTTWVWHQELNQSIEEANPKYASVMKISAGNTWSGSIGVLPTEAAYGDARTLYVEGTWTLGSGEQRLGGGGLIVVRNGGKIVIPSGSSLQSANGGRIVVLKGGTIEGDGLISFNNGSGDSYDYIAAGATVNVGTMNNNGGRVFNYGTMTINELQGGAGLSTYINHGHMTVNHSTYGSQSSNARILTDCQLEVTNNLCCKIINMGNPSYVHVGGNLIMSGSYDGTNDDAECVMAANAYLKVDGGVALNNASIVGPTSGFAVCEFGKIGDPDGIVKTNYTPVWQNNRTEISNGYVINNLDISIDNVEEPITDYNNPYAMFISFMLNGRGFDSFDNGKPSYNGSSVGNGNAHIVKKGEADVNVDESECVPGYNPNKVAPVTPETQSFIIACEDLGSTKDVDYNDVVFSISHAAGQNYITVTPLAAGGTLAANIQYGDQPVGEVHALLGESNTKMMINTASQTATNVGTPVTLTVPDDWTFSSNYKNFKIQITTNNNESKFVEAPTEGSAPFMIIVPGNWCWPLERVSIEDAYSGFKDWSQDSAINDKWISSKVEGKTVNR